MRSSVSVGRWVGCEQVRARTLQFKNICAHQHMVSTPTVRPLNAVMHTGSSTPFFKSRSRPGMPMARHTNASTGRQRPGTPKNPGLMEVMV